MESGPIKPGHKYSNVPSGNQLKATASEISYNREQKITDLVEMIASGALLSAIDIDIVALTALRARVGRLGTNLGELGIDEGDATVLLAFLNGITNSLGTVNRSIEAKERWKIKDRLHQQADKELASHATRLGVAVQELPPRIVMAVWCHYGIAHPPSSTAAESLNELYAELISLIETPEV